MSAEDNVQTAKDIYSAFERGDIETIISKLDDDVDWDISTAASHNVAYYMTCKGRAAVKEKFFGAIAETVDVTRFERHDFVASDNNVPVTYSGMATIKKSARSYSIKGMHFLTFTSDGKLASCRGYEDTAVVVEAWRG